GVNGRMSNWLRSQRGWAYLKAGRPEDAVKSARVIVDLAIRDLEATPPGTLAQRKEVAKTLHTHGVLLRKFGRWHESIAAFQEAIRKVDQWTLDFPSEFHRGSAANCRFELAYVYQFLGKTTEANCAADEGIAIQQKIATSGRPMNRLWLATHLRH